MIGGNCIPFPTEDWQMKINWGRVVNAGLVAEILLLLIYEFVVQLYGHGTVTVTVIAGCFAFMLVGALWVGRGIESHFILHGFLVGVVAVVYYVVRTLPDALSGQYPMNEYWMAALGGHTPKLLGGIVGGYIAGRRKFKAV